MAQLPLWMQWIQAIATGAIAIFAAFIAYRQTAHQRVVLDLFERRMAVYEAARSVIGEIMREGAADTALFFRYVQATDRLPLLFGDEVVEFSDLTRKRINKLSVHRAMIKAQNDGTFVPNYAAHVDQEAKTLDEISKFYDEFATLVMLYVRMTQKLERWPWSRREDRKKATE
jgi:hypothetical protein